MSKHIQLRPRTVGILVMAAVGALALAATALAASGSNGGLGVTAAQKQAFLSQVQAARATAATLPRAPKPSGTNARPPASCSTTVQTGIGPFRGGPFHGGNSMTTVAWVVSSQGVPYVIYAGALDEDPQQGVLVVLRLNRDPCAAATGGSDTYQRTYNDPSRQGALTLTAIDGDRVIFTSANGSTGAFNYVTGQYD